MILYLSLTLYISCIYDVLEVTKKIKFWQDSGFITFKRQLLL